MVSLNSKDLDAYLLKVMGSGDPLLEEIFRVTNARMNRPRMVSDAVKGRFLSMMSHLVQPSLVVEVGTFTGYSALCLAEGLAEGGRVITFDCDDEVEDLARGFFARSPLSERIDFRIGDARQEIPLVEGPVDLAFLDGEKDEYIDYFKALWPMMRPGGLVIADNVLWDGKVLEPEERQDKSTRGIVAFSRYVARQSGLEMSLLPMGDGLLLLRKI